MAACTHTHTHTHTTVLQLSGLCPGELVLEGTFRHLLDFLAQNEDSTGWHNNNPDGQVSLLKKGEILSITTASHWIRTAAAVAKTSSSVLTHSRSWHESGPNQWVRQHELVLHILRDTLHCTDTVDYKTWCQTVLPSDGGWVRSASAATQVMEVTRSYWAVVTGVPAPSLEIRKMQEWLPVLSFDFQSKKCKNLRHRVPLRRDPPRSLQDGDRKQSDAEVPSPSLRTLHGKSLREGIVPNTFLHDKPSFPNSSFLRFLPSVSSFCSGSLGYLSNRLSSRKASDKKSHSFLPLQYQVAQAEVLWLHSLTWNRKRKLLPNLHLILCRRLQDKWHEARYSTSDCSKASVPRDS